MHYYKRNLGDYAKKAGRLSMLQHGAYTLLIDACYDREQFPTLEEAIDWTWASSAAEIEAVEFVLRKFFVLEDGRYVQKRIQEEITDYHDKSATNARIAKEREAKRNESSTNRARVVDEAPPNQEPITNNQEDTPKPPSQATGADDRAGKKRKPQFRDDLFDRFWSAYPSKVGKDAARKAFGKREVDDALLETMLSALADQKQSVGWVKDGGQFIPHPSTWINQGRWQDGETSADLGRENLFAGAI